MQEAQEWPPATSLTLLRSAVTPAGSGQNQPSGKKVYPSCPLSTIFLSCSPLAFTQPCQDSPITTPHQQGPPSSFHPYRLNKGRMLPLEGNTLLSSGASAGDMTTHDSKKLLDPYQGLSTLEDQGHHANIKSLLTFPEREPTPYGR